MARSLAIFTIFLCMTAVFAADLRRLAAQKADPAADTSKTSDDQQTASSFYGYGFYGPGYGGPWGGFGGPWGGYGYGGYGYPGFFGGYGGYGGYGGWW